ncbi:MAG: YfiR family protein [Candidatus Hydrogenedentes bacterium]|nr:YfiR family protein [Candidatus Hydrogenedentota bacterium]
MAILENIWALGPRRDQAFRRIACLLLAVALSVPAVHGQRSASEEELKAAFIFRFLNFIEWPENTFEKEDDPIIVGLLGESPMEKELDKALSGKYVQERPLQLKLGATAEALKDCQVVFIAESASEELAAVLEQLKGAPIVTVSDLPDFARKGGMIQLFRADNKVRFDINMDSVKSAKIKISSRLIQLASSILSAEDTVQESASRS